MAFADAARDFQRQPSEFELRRAELVGQIGDSLDQVLTQINALNRTLESIIEIGNEFAAVEALWSQFETVAGAQQQHQQQQQQHKGKENSPKTQIQMPTLTVSGSGVSSSAELS